jgi:hypothetical protein
MIIIKSYNLKYFLDIDVFAAYRSQGQLGQPHLALTLSAYNFKKKSSFWSQGHISLGLSQDDSCFRKPLSNKV